MPATTAQAYHSRLMPSLSRATVSDAMHAGILTCEPDATLTDVARLMAGHRVHCIAVMGVSHAGSSEKLVWGIISDVDVVRAGIRTGSDRLAGALALEPIITVEPEMPLRQAGELMLSHNTSHIVVIDPQLQRPIGILSTLDIIDVLAGDEIEI